MAQVADVARMNGVEVAVGEYQPFHDGASSNRRDLSAYQKRIITRPAVTIAHRSDRTVDLLESVMGTHQLLQLKLASLLQP